MWAGPAAGHAGLQPLPCAPALPAHHAGQSPHLVAPPVRARRLAARGALGLPCRDRARGPEPHLSRGGTATPLSSWARDLSGSLLPTEVTCLNLVLAPGSHLPLRDGHTPTPPLSGHPFPAPTRPSSHPRRWPAQPSSPALAQAAPWPLLCHRLPVAYDTVKPAPQRSTATTPVFPASQGPVLPHCLASVSTLHPAVAKADPSLSLSCKKHLSVLCSRSCRCHQRHWGKDPSAADLRGSQLGYQRRDSQPLQSLVSRQLGEARVQIFGQIILGVSVKVSFR